jgi:NAD(P)-dependent dehydrogenase (short-subunit alcohol dehydrogenase family)
MSRGWCADDMGDLHGQRVLVTGANSGIGYETALALARKGATVVMACRRPERGEAAAGRIEAEVPKAELELATLDLADLASIRDFAASWSGRTLDVLVDNAGVMAIPHRVTADGFEMQFGTNHLGHFALAGRLLPSLLGSPAPRVVTVSSFAHLIGRIDFADLQHERRYGRWGAYGQAKLANLLFALELDRRAKAAGSTLRSVAAHPGYAATNLQTTGPAMEGRAFMVRFNGWANHVFAQSAAAGALPSLYAATAPDLAGGEFIGPVYWMRGAPTRAWCTPLARDRAVAQRLWSVSEELTGVRYDFSVTGRQA